MPLTSWKDSKIRPKSLSDMRNFIAHDYEGVDTALFHPK